MCWQFCKLALAKYHRFHTAVQVFESIRKLGPYLYDRFLIHMLLTGHCSRNQFKSWNFFWQVQFLLVGSSPLESVAV